MKSKYVYISRSKHIPIDSVEELAESIIDNGNASSRWHVEPNEYQESWLTSADLVVIMVDSGRELGKGSYEEFLKAQKLGIPAVIGYRRSCDSTIQLYTIRNVSRLGQNWQKYAVVTFGSNITKETFKFMREVKSLEFNYKEGDVFTKKLDSGSIGDWVALDSNDNELPGVMHGGTTYSENSFMCLGMTHLKNGKLYVLMSYIDTDNVTVQLYLDPSDFEVAKPESKTRVKKVEEPEWREHMNSTSVGSKNLMLIVRRARRLK